MITSPIWAHLGLKPAEISEFAVDPEAFRVLLRLLPRDPLQRNNVYDYEGIKI